ncbi:hypothetical protein [Methylobacterium durans]|uniref:hypothetical protein n=1 Tax=Methylobacterium durans TaxID=2202825 RepID=UPI0013A54059|nr:hypothetical protein [Methylobacterium durans]
MALTEMIMPKQTFEELFLEAAAARSPREVRSVALLVEEVPVAPQLRFLRKLFDKVHIAASLIEIATLIEIDPEIEMVMVFSMASEEGLEDYLKEIHQDHAHLMIVSVETQFSISWESRQIETQQYFNLIEYEDPESVGRSLSSNALFFKEIVQAHRELGAPKT